MNTETVFEQLHQLIEARDMKQLRARLAEMNEIDVAEFLMELEPENVRVVFRLLPKQLGAEVFAYLDSDLQQTIIESATDTELTVIVEGLYTDDAVDMVEELPANVVKRVLKSATPETRALINQYLNYPENSAGSMMTAEYIELNTRMTVREAIERIRTTGEESESIYTCFVRDTSRELVGVVEVKELLLASDDALVRDIMDTDVISVSTHEDQEEVAKLMSHYDLVMLPVVDNERRLLGVVTIDDAMDVMQQEATEDFEVMSGILPNEKTYLKTGVLEMSRNRILWLLVLMLSGMLTGGILSNFEAAIAAMPMLVTFVPMLTDTGGNAGSQASTMIIRGLATGDLTLGDLPRVLWKEMRVALIVGTILALVNLVRIGIQYGDWLVAATLAMTMMCTVMMAKLLGCTLPMLANALHLDPALMASPLITTTVDACSLLIYFAICTHLLPL